MEHKDDSMLKFSREDYEKMVKQVLEEGKHELFIKIVDNILKWKFVSWRGNEDVRRYNLGDDLYGEVHYCLIKEAEGLIFRNGAVVDPHYFQALILTVGVGRFLNLLHREKYAHGNLSAPRFQPLRKALGMEDEDGVKQTQIPMVSVETGGYSEDEEEIGIDIPDPENGYIDVEVIDQFERMSYELNDEALNSKKKPHIILTWFLFITNLRRIGYDNKLVKGLLENLFSEMTLSELVRYIDQHRDTIYSAKVTDEQVEALYALVSGPVGDTVYNDYCMQGKTLRATISDWLNRWNTAFKEKGYY